jgi:hypothetical protein
MTTPPIISVRRRDVRAVLIKQQERAPNSALALPLVLRSPFILLVWAALISIVVVAMMLGRVRVPRTAHGMVVAAHGQDTSLTPILLLPAWSRQFVRTGELATVDTGGAVQFTATISRVDAVPLTLASARVWLNAPNVGAATIDTTMVVAHLKPCTGQGCLRLATGVRYAATASLGTRSLASFAIPGS